MVCAAFCNDIDWLVNDIFPRNVPVALAMHKGPNQEAGYGRHNDLTNLMVVLPPIASTMHIKFFFIFFETFTRIVVPTANNVDYDWGEGNGGAIENAVRPAAQSH